LHAKYIKYVSNYVFLTLQTSKQSEMRQLISIIALLAFTTINVQSQTYNSPECIRWDPVNEKYLVSNVAGNSDGYILHVDPENDEKTVFATDGLRGPKGMTIYDGVVYVSDINQVEGYQLSDGAQVFHIDVSGSAWLNGITADKDGNLYVGDTDVSKIYKIVPSAGTVTTFVSSGITGVNGVYYDEANNRLIACFWRSNAPLSAIDLETAEVTNLIETPYSNLDGIARDNCGNYYFSSWGTNKVYRTNTDFTEEPVVVEQDLSGPADIFFNTLTQELCVPNFSANTFKRSPVFLPCMQAQLLSPEDGSNDQPSRNLVFSWIAVKHVKSYKLEISLTPVFTEIVLALASGSPELIVENLDVNSTYYWRVSASDGGVFSENSDTFTFTTEESSGVNLQERNESIRVFPNPASDKIGLVWDDLSINVRQIQVLNLMGQVVWQIDMPINNKGFQYIDVNKWPRGLYVIKCVETEDQMIIRRVIIH